MKTNLDNSISTVPSINTALLTEFYVSAQEIYQLAPWKNCSDSDFFGVLVPETGELHFVSIMGGAGQCFGLATYRGIAGLDLLSALLDGLFEADPVLVQRRQDGLMLEFVEQGYLDIIDINYSQQANFQPTTDDSWVMVRDFSRGWGPWWPTEKNLVSMNSIFSTLPQFIELQKENAEWTTKMGKYVYPIFVQSTEPESQLKWKLEWWSDEKVVKSTQAQEVEAVFHHEALAMIKALPRGETLYWEAYSFYAPEAEVTDGRPFFPEVCVVMDQASKKCLSMEIIHPTQDRNIVLRELFIKAIQLENIVPNSLVIEETDILPSMLPVKNALDFKIKVNAAKAGRQFQAGMFKDSKVRIFN